jgi:hypothetical protein
LVWIGPKSHMKWSRRLRSIWLTRLCASSSCQPSQQRRK